MTNVASTAGHGGDVSGVQPASSAAARPQTTRRNARHSPPCDERVATVASEGDASGLSMEGQGMRLGACADERGAGGRRRSSPTPEATRPTLRSVGSVLKLGHENSRPFLGTGLEVAAHAAAHAATVLVAAGWSVFLGLICDKRLGGQQETSDASRVLQGTAHDLRRVDNAVSDEVAE